MNTPLKTTLAAVALLLAGLAAGWALSQWRSGAAHDGPAAAAGAASAAHRRAQGAVLVRPDVADAEVRQARQVAVHGHAAGGKVRRRRRYRQRGPARHQHLAAGAAVARCACRGGREARAVVGDRGGRHGGAQRARREHRAVARQRLRRTRLRPRAGRCSRGRCAAGRRAAARMAGRAAGVPGRSCNR